MKTMNVKQIDNLKATNGKIKTISDGATGLLLRVYPSGKKSFFVRVRNKQTDLISKLGEYPYLSLADARAKAMEIKQKAKTTRTPKEAIAPKTTGELMAEWIDKKEREAEARGKSFTKEAQRLELHALTKLKKIPIHKLEYIDIVEILKPLEAQGKIDTMHKVRSMILEFLLYAKGLGYTLNFSVAEAREDLRQALEKRNRQKHFATLTDEADVKKFFAGLKQFTSKKMELAIKLHAMTLVRPNELRQAEWKEIDFNNAVWTIPAIKMKMKREHKIPLSRQAIEVLQELHTISHTSRYVLPQDNDDSRPISDNTERLAIKRVCEALSLPPMVAHGIRGLASTYLNANGFNADVIETALAHSAEAKNSIRSAYNHHDYFEERKDMLQWWSDRIENIIKIGYTEHA